MLSGLGTGIVDGFDMIALGTDGNPTNFLVYTLTIVGGGLAIGVIVALVKKLG